MGLRLAQEIAGGFNAESAARRHSINVLSLKNMLRSAAHSDIYHCAPDFSGGRQIFWKQGVQREVKWCS
jgi:hypothetical protein